MKFLVSVYITSAFSNTLNWFYIFFFYRLPANVLQLALHSFSHGMHRCVGRSKALTALHYILLNNMSLLFYNVQIFITKATILDIFCLLKGYNPKLFRSRVFLCMLKVRRKGAAEVVLILLFLWTIFPTWWWLK